MGSVPHFSRIFPFWVPEAARWENLRAQAKQPDIGKRIDDALTLIETENPKLKGILDKRYARDLLGQVYTFILGQLRLPDAEVLIEEAAA